MREKKRRDSLLSLSKHKESKTYRLKNCTKKIINQSFIQIIKKEQASSKSLEAFILILPYTKFPTDIFVAYQVYIADFLGFFFAACGEA